MSLTNPVGVEKKDPGVGCGLYVMLIECVAVFDFFCFIEDIEIFFRLGPVASLLIMGGGAFSSDFEPFFRV